MRPGGCHIPEVVVFMQEVDLARSNSRSDIRYQTVDDFRSNRSAFMKYHVFDGMEDRKNGLAPLVHAALAAIVSRLRVCRVWGESRCKKVWLGHMFESCRVTWLSGGCLTPN
jgi:hypothetical protein